MEVWARWRTGQTNKLFQTRTAYLLLCTAQTMQGRFYEFKKWERKKITQVFMNRVHFCCYCGNGGAAMAKSQFNL